MRFYVDETKNRSDGDTDHITTEKYSRAEALSYYYARKSAYLVDTTYVSAGIICRDSDANILANELVPTQYKAD